MFNDDVVNADPMEMERFGEELDRYVNETRALCDDLIQKINSAANTGAFSGTAEQEAVLSLITWLKAVKDPLPEATSMSSKLKEAAENYQRAIEEIEKRL